MALEQRNTRDCVIAQATELIRRKGFRATSISEVIAASGIKKGGLYHYFPGKADLGLTLLKSAREEFLQFLDDVLVGDTPAKALVHFFNAALRKHQQTGFVGGCLFGNTALEMADEDQAYADVVSSVFDEWITRIERVIGLAQESGEVRDDLSARCLAQVVVMSIEGGIMLTRLRKDESSLVMCLDVLKTMLRPPVTFASGRRRLPETGDKTNLRPRKAKGETK